MIGLGDKISYLDALVGGGIIGGQLRPATFVSGFHVSVFPNLSEGVIALQTPHSLSLTL
jgi:hypothetical protein